MDAGWFIREVCERTRWCDLPPLVTTCTDGDNGGWFRNTADGANFWSAFHDDLLTRTARGEAGGIRPVFIDDYLDAYGTHGEVTVRTAAWNTGWHHGADFTQWTGSAAQRDALDRVARVSALVRERPSEQALLALLRAQTSCHFYWGEAWIPRCHADLDRAERALAG